MFWPRRPVSRANEELALRTLRDTLAALLATYPITAEEDEVLLAMAAREPPRVRAAYLLRLREKRLLEAAREHLSELEDRLDSLRYATHLTIKNTDGEYANRRTQRS